MGSVLVRLDGLVASVGDHAHQLLLVVRVAPTVSTRFGHQVVAPAQLDVDVAPCLVHAVARRERATLKVSAAHATAATRQPRKTYMPIASVIYRLPHART